MLARVVVGGVLALVAGAAVSAAPLRLTIEDVRGARVALGAPAQRRPVILIFMSRRARDASAAFARAIDERLLARAVESVGVVDVRPYRGLLRGLATRYLRRSAEEARVRRRQRRLAHRVDASPAAVDRWHLVGDFDGALFARFGVAPEPAAPLAFVVAPDGVVHGPYGDVHAVVTAVTALDATR